MCVFCGRFFFFFPSKKRNVSEIIYVCYGLNRKEAPRNYWMNQKRAKRQNHKTVRWCFFRWCYWNANQILQLEKKRSQWNRNYKLNYKCHKFYFFSHFYLNELSFISIYNFPVVWIIYHYGIYYILSYSMILFVAVGNADAVAVAAATIAVHFLHRCYQFQWNFLCIWFHDCTHSFPIPILIFLSFRFELYIFFSLHSVFIFFFRALHSIQKIICHKYSKIIMHKGARTERSS